MGEGEGTGIAGEGGGLGGRERASSAADRSCEKTMKERGTCVKEGRAEWAQRLKPENELRV